MAIQTKTYSTTLYFGEFNRSWTISEYLNRFFGLDIANSYEWSSEDNLKYLFEYGSEDFSLAGLGAYAEANVEGGDFNVGVEAAFGFNLGELHIELPLSPSLEAYAQDSALIFNFLPTFNGGFKYIEPYAYASLAAVFDYNIGSATVSAGYSNFLNSQHYGPEELFPGGEGSWEYDIINLDTRETEQTVNLPFLQEKVNTLTDPKIELPVGEYLNLGIHLPTFNSDFTSTSSENEYSLEITSETTLLDVTLHLDKILSEIPQLKWITGDTDDFIEFDLFGGGEFELDIKWDVIPIDVIAELGFGYAYEIGIRNLKPEIVGGELTEEVNPYSIIDDLLAKDVDYDSKIDLYLEFNPDVFFSARAYISPDLKLDIDVARLFLNYEIEVPFSNSESTFNDEFVVIDNEEFSLSEKLDMSFDVDIFKSEISIPFDEFYYIATGDESPFKKIHVEVPLNSIFPNVGTSGNDLLFLPESAGVENLYGEAGNDLLIGNSSGNRIMGASGSDTIFAGAGSDTIYGDLRHIYADLAYSQQHGGADAIYGGDGNDIIFAGGGSDFVDGGAGNDTIRGEFGNDLIYGGAGDDHITGGDGDDEIHGGSGNDLIYGDSGFGHDRLFGGEGNDTLYGRVGNDYISGGLDDDIVYGEEGDDVIDGDTGNDALYGGADNDVVSGGEGDDLIRGEAGNDQIRGDTGNDLIGGDSGDDLINGGDGDDQISGGADDDTIFGDAGTDLIQGDDGNDRISGGTGNDIISGGNGDDKITGDVGDDLISGGAGNDTINGGDDNDIIYGDGGDDDITGDAGDDKAYGGDGADTMSGGDGDDQLFGDAGEDTMTGNDGADQLAGGDGNDWISGGADDDFINGQTGNDQLYGDGGNDIIYGEEGEDEIYGGDGDDRMIGGEGGDLLDGGEGNDIISYYTSSEGVDIQLQPGRGTGGDAEGDRIYGVENVEGSHHNDNLIGSNGDNSLIGLDGADFLDGKVGNDSLYGGNGNDHLEGRQGNDLLHGGDGSDLLDGGSGDDDLIGGAGDDRLYGGRSGNDRFSAGDGDDYVNASSGDDIIYAGAGDDYVDAGAHNDIVFGGDGDDIIIGHTGNDWLFGNAGTDTLYASSGDNLLFGGEGDDLLYGGQGQGVDTFVLGTGFGIDSIFDFNFETDRLGLVGGLTASDLTFTKGIGDYARDVFVDLFDGTRLAILEGLQWNPGNNGKSKKSQSQNFQAPSIVELASLPEALGADPLLGVSEPPAPPELGGSEIFPGSLEPAPMPTLPTVGEIA